MGLSCPADHRSFRATHYSMPAGTKKRKSFPLDSPLVGGGGKWYANGKREREKGGGEMERQGQNAGVVPAGQRGSALLLHPEAQILRQLPLLRRDGPAGGPRRPSAGGGQDHAPLPLLPGAHQAGAVLVLLRAQRRPRPLCAGGHCKPLSACALQGGQRLAGALLLLQLPHLHRGVPRRVRRGGHPGALQDPAGGLPAGAGA